MADQVEAVLDHMVPTLRDLLDRGIFLENEIHAIVSRRRESEYLIRRRDCRKTDFARYIEAEKNLEKLRSLRSKKIIKLKKIDEDSKKNKSKESNTASRSSSMADASIIQHIHFIYSRAKRKWKEDLTWHLQHVDFAKSVKSFHLLGKIYAEALQLHPRCTHLWIEAASHEYFGYSVDSLGMAGIGSIRNARVLLQRGLRINPTSEDLWIQYFHLELHYIQKLRGRRNILQPEWDKEDKIRQTLTSEKKSEEVNEAEEALYDNLLPLIVYKNAIKAIPKTVSFRFRFLDLCSKFSDTESIEQEIRSSIELDCSDSVDAWLIQAKHVLESGTVRQDVDDTSNIEDDTSDDENKVVGSEDLRKRKLEANHDTSNIDWDTILTKLNNILEKSTDRISSNEMYLNAIRFLKEMIVTWHLDGNDRMVNIIDQLFGKASDRGIESYNLTIESAHWLVLRGKISEANDLFYKTLLIDGRFVTHAQLWIQWSDVCRMHKTTLSPEFILQRALGLVPMHDKAHFEIASTLFVYQLQSIGSYEENSAKIQSLTTLFDKLLLLSAQDVFSTADDISLSSRMLNICASYLQYAILAKDTEFIRSIYTRIFYSSSFLNNCEIDHGDSMEKIQYMFDASISVEQELARKPRKDWRTRAQSVQSRRLIDTAVAFFERKGIHKLTMFYKNRCNN